MKRQATNWEKIFVNHISDKKSCTKIIQRTLKIQQLENKQPN